MHQKCLPMLFRKRTELMDNNDSRSANEHQEPSCNNTYR